MRTRKRITIFVMMLLIAVFLVACGDKEDGALSVEPQTAESVSEELETDVFEEIPTPSDLPEKNPSDSADEPVVNIILPSVFDYTGEPYAVINNNIPSFSEFEKKQTDSFENYSIQDTLGRCGVAYANISPDTLPTEERGEIGSVKPTGWHTVKYSEVIDDNYLYNRCHLIAYELAGENANERNLITGTRYMNVQGMLPFENMVADFVWETGYHVLYRVTPVFVGDNLVADGVQIEAWSVEDSGAGICLNVFCFNVQPNITIDYATGESEISAEYLAATAAVTEEPVMEAPVAEAPVTEQPVAEEPVVETPAAETPAVAEVTEPEPSSTPAAYILNTNTKKFHYPYCDSVKEMKEKNKAYSNDSRDQIIAMGYKACKICNP